MQPGEIPLKLGDETLFPKCLQDLFTRVDQTCLTWGTADSNEYGDCLKEQLLTGRYFRMYDLSWNSSFMVRTLCGKTSAEGGQIAPIDNTCPNQYVPYSGRLYLDSSCNLVEQPTDMELVCESAQIEWRDSPISLLWEPEVEIDNDIALVQFPLDPGMVGKWYEWKASAKAPLLVYDPTHQGRIVSAYQLFGNWTFGGRRLALSGMNDSSDYMTRTEQSWENGYEALATLDGDGDGKINGEELEPLALWFDKNRDGISQAGEVVSAKSVGLTALYYKPDKTDKETGSIYTTQGFELTKGADRVIGTTVDWYGERGSSIAELMSKRGLRTSVCDHTTDTQLHLPKLSKEASGEKSLANHNSVIRGMWKWSFAPTSNAPFDQDSKTQGILAFDGDALGNIAGYSFTSTALLPESTNETLLSFSRLEGTTSLTIEGNLRLTFIVKPRLDMEIETEALLSNDHRILRGTSTARLYRGGKESRITYHWIAHR